MLLWNDNKLDMLLKESITFSLMSRTNKYLQCFIEEIRISKHFELIRFYPRNNFSILFKFCKDLAIVQTPSSLIKQLYNFKILIFFLWLSKFASITTHSFWIKFPLKSNSIRLILFAKELIKYLKPFPPIELLGIIKCDNVVLLWRVAVSKSAPLMKREEFWIYNSVLTSKNNGKLNLGGLYSLNRIYLKTSLG